MTSGWRGQGWLDRRVPADRIVAAALALMLSPVLGLTALLVRIRDGAPVLVRLPRVGRHGRVFAQVKLRTMAESARTGDEAVTLGTDPRITRTGRHLRRWRLDELPQLWNIITADMALIGPRPEAPEFVDDGEPGWQRALSVRPGLAGATQAIVHHREQELTSAEEYRSRLLPRKLAVDGWYVDNASPAVDARIVISVIAGLLRPGRVTPIERRVAGDLPTTVDELILPPGRRR